VCACCVGLTFGLTLYVVPILYIKYRHYEYYTFKILLLVLMRTNKSLDFLSVESIRASSLLGFNFPRNLHVGFICECHATLCFLNGFVCFLVVM
jgi:hypothetical protein